MNQQLLTAFFEDLARALDYWVDTVAKTVEDPQTSGPWMEEREPFDRLHEVLGDRAEYCGPFSRRGCADC